MLEIYQGMHDKVSEFLLIGRAFEDDFDAAVRVAQAADCSAEGPCKTVHGLWAEKQMGPNIKLCKQTPL